MSEWYAFALVLFELSLCFLQPLRDSTRTLSRDHDINDNVSTPRRSPAVGNSPLARLRSSVTQFGGKLRRMNSSRDSSQSRCT